MKRIAFLLVFTWASQSLSAEVTIRTEASFGAKKKDCVKGLGMCSAKTTTKEADNWLMVWLTLSDDESVLTLGLPNTTVAELEGQITGNSFIQDEDYSLSAEISQAFGISGYLTIPAGSYSIQHAEGKVLVRIPVTTSAVGLR